MTFEEWRRMTLLPGDNVKAAWKAWEASRTYARSEFVQEGFSLGTEAAAKLFDRTGTSTQDYFDAQHRAADAAAIRALRYEDVKGEKDG